MMTKQGFILRVGILLLGVVCMYAQPGQPQQASGYEYIPNFRRQWYYAYYNCSQRGGTLVNPNSNSPALVNFIEDIQNKDPPLNRWLWSSERYWSNEECENFYLSNSVLTRNTFTSCYYPRSWICDETQPQPPVPAQGSNFDYTPNLRRQWFFAYWDCRRKGGSLVDPNSNSQALVDFITEIQNKDPPLRLQHWLGTSERYWSNTECENFYMSNSRLVMNNNVYKSCYYPRSWICALP